MTDTALYFTAPETVEVRETAVGPPAADELELVDDTRVGDKRRDGTARVSRPDAGRPPGRRDP